MAKPSDCAESLRYRDFLLVGLIVNRKDVFGSNRLTSYKLTSSNASLEETQAAQIKFERDAELSTVPPQW